MRWAGNAVTTNGSTEQVTLSVVSIIGRRAATVTRTGCPPGELESLVRASEAACLTRPPAPDYMPLLAGTGAPGHWSEAPADADPLALDPLVADLAPLFAAATQAGIETFGYAEQAADTIWVAASTGLRRRHVERAARISVTGKSADLARSVWAGQAAPGFEQVGAAALFETLRRRLEWSTARFDLPAGLYETILEPSCVADLAIEVQSSMIRRDAEEGRSPFARPGGGTRIGDRLFGDVTMYSDPAEPGLESVPFGVCAVSDEASSVFDNGLTIPRTDWVRDGVLQSLVTPRYWAAGRADAAVVPAPGNLVVAGGDTSIDAMVARTERALLVSSLWYIRTVDPQTALVTGLTRDGVFLVQEGRIRGAVNNFRWNMSPVAVFAQTVERSTTAGALPREHDESLHVRAPGIRVERFNMSSVSDAR